MSDNFRVRIDELPEFTARMRRAPQIMQRHLVTAVDRSTTEGERLSKGFAPVKTGHLRRSITNQPATFAGGSVRGAWGTNVPYAPYQEFGTRRGIRPKRFMGRAFDRIKSAVRREFGAALQRAMQEIGGGR